jgi:hypothetical protein
MLPLACPGFSLDLGIADTIRGVLGALGSGLFTTFVVFPSAVFAVGLIAATVWHLATPFRGEE